MGIRRGQVALYLLVVLVALTLLALLNVDVFTAVRGKMRVENAGDAAALAAAHRQAELLNAIGRLNLEHIGAALSNDVERCREIELEQRRLCLLGPVEALRDANEAALKNGQEVNDRFAEILLRHVEDIRNIYAGDSGTGSDPYPESYPGAWFDYALAISEVVKNGLAVGPDNIEFYNAAGGHPLLDREFYYAISGKNWCWFKWNLPGLLDTYSGWQSWWPLPSRDEDSFENSEIFSLHLRARSCVITDLIKKTDLVKLLECTEEELASSHVLTNAQTWFFYQPWAWSEWSEMNPFEGSDDYGPMPIIGEVKPEYYVRGCAAICRCVYDVPAVAVDDTATLTWAAAAKPFGSVIDLEGEVAPVTAWFDFVLPSFEAVRLVPLDSVGGRNLATADFGWVEHLREHIPIYLSRGPLMRDCFYCQQLVTWENPMFRSQGSTWLKYHSSSCRRPVGGHGGHGGTAHGH